MKLNEHVDAAHKNAIEKGWHEPSPTFGEIIALIHSELSEALEDYRIGYDPTEIYYEEDDKPCGIPVEFADALFRIFDACGQYGINLEYAVRVKMEYNKTRPIRHGGKKI